MSREECQILSAKSIGLLTVAFRRFRSLEDSGPVQLSEYRPLLPQLPTFVPSISHTSFLLSPKLDYCMVSYPFATVLETQKLPALQCAMGMS